MISLHPTVVPITEGRTVSSDVMVRPSDVTVTCCPAIGRQPPDSTDVTGRHGEIFERREKVDR